MSWEIDWTEPALDDMHKLDGQVRKRVFATIERLAETGHGDVKRLQGPAREWRLRVGDWRVLFVYDFPKHTMRIGRVLSRGRAYRR